MSIVVLTASRTQAMSVRQVDGRPLRSTFNIRSVLQKTLYAKAKLKPTLPNLQKPSEAYRKFAHSHTV